jgi:hypothetical protein
MLRIFVGATFERCPVRLLVVVRGPCGDAERPSVKVERSGVVSEASVTRWVPCTVHEAALEVALRERETHLFLVTCPLASSDRADDHVDVRASFRSDVARTRFRAVPHEANGTSFALASCYFGELGRATSFGAALDLAARSHVLGGHRIDFKLFVGDNVYADVAVDQNAFSPVDGAYAEIATRYVRTFVDDDAMALALASSPTFFTYDDHELWNDFPHRNAWLSRSWDPHRGLWTGASIAGLEAFQVPLNPERIGASRSYAFHAGQVPFFVADTRSERTSAEEASPCLLPPDALDALEAFLRAPGGPRVLVIGQPLWLEARSKTFLFTTDHNLAAYEAAFARIVNALDDCPSDVLVLSGDVHYSRILRLETSPGAHVYEVVSSPAAHIPTSGSTAKHAVFGGTRDVIGEDAIQIADAVELRGARVRLRECGYLAGTSSVATLALVSIRPRGEGSLEVTVDFVDHRASPPRLLASERAGRREPEFSGTATFALGPRTRSRR